MLNVAQSATDGYSIRAADGMTSSARCACMQNTACGLGWKTTNERMARGVNRTRWQGAANPNPHPSRFADVPHPPQFANVPHPPQFASSRAPPTSIRQRAPPTLMPDSP